MIPRLNDLRLSSIDLRQAIGLGVEHIYQGAIDRKRGCLPLVRFGLTESPIGLDTNTGAPRIWSDVFSMPSPSARRSLICPRMSRR